MRPIRPDDKERLAAGHERLSEHTAWLRYLRPKSRLTAAEVRYLTEVDGRNHVALVVLRADDREAMVAVGRFVRDLADPSTAEFAIVVGDRYQRRGLGTALAGLLAEEARRHGIRRLRALTAAENVAVSRLLARIDRGLKVERQDGATRELVVELAA